MTGLRTAADEAGNTPLADFAPVYVVEAQAEARRELVAMLRGAGLVVREFASPAGFLEQLGGLDAGCVVAVPCPHGGPALPPELAGRGCAFPFVAIVPPRDVAEAVRAMKAGAADVVARPVTPDALARAVRAALAGIDRNAADPATAELRQRFTRLTRRERQVLDAMMQGEANKAIAARLGISPRTVEVHRAKVMEKLACRSLPELVRLALQAGLAAG